MIFLKHCKWSVKVLTQSFLYTEDRLEPVNEWALALLVIPRKADSR